MNEVEKIPLKNEKSEFMKDFEERQRLVHYHRWYLDYKNPEVLYLTDNNRKRDDLTEIGHSFQIPWLERLLQKENPVPFEKVFYPIDIERINEDLTSESVRDWMNTPRGVIGPIRPGMECKLRGIEFYRPALDPPKLFLFHSYFNRDETESIVNSYIPRNKFIYHVGRMNAITQNIRSIELLASPPQIEIDYTSQINKINNSVPKSTLGDILGPLLYKK